MIRATCLLAASFLALSFAGCVVAPYPAYPPPYEHVTYYQPRVTLIAGTGIYWAADYDADVFYYGGRWYWCDGPFWYYSVSWGDPWIYISTPPTIFLRIPQSHPRYRVTIHHPSSPTYSQYWKSVAGRYQSAPTRRGFRDLPGVPAAPPRDGRSGDSPNGAAPAGGQGNGPRAVQPRPSRPNETPGRGPRDDNQGRGPWAEQPKPGGPNETPGRGPRDDDHGRRPDAGQPKPNEPKETPGRGPRDDDHGRGPDAGQPKPNEPKDTPGRGPRDDDHGKGPKAEQPKPGEHPTPPDRKPKDEDKDKDKDKDKEKDKHKDK